jgi:hypothetical protein
MLFALRATDLEKFLPLPTVAGLTFDNEPATGGELGHDPSANKRRQLRHALTGATWTS